MFDNITITHLLNGQISLSENAHYRNTTVTIALFNYIRLCRLISVEDVRNYLSDIIYLLIFYFFLNFLLFVRLQTPTSLTKMLEGGIMVSERQMRFNENL